MTLTLKQKNPKLVAAGIKGGQATLARHGIDHYKRIGALPPREGSAPKGRPTWQKGVSSEGI